MKFDLYDGKRDILAKGYENICWTDGDLPEKLVSDCTALYRILEDEKTPFCITKAKIFEHITQHGRIAVDKDGIFCEKLEHCGIINKITWDRMTGLYENELSDVFQKSEKAKKFGVFEANPDFGHLSPDSKTLLALGFTGLLSRVRKYRANIADSENEKNAFYTSCEITLNAAISFIKRLADAARHENPAASDVLKAISERAPQNTYEALALFVVYFYLHEFVYCSRVRTMGRLDELMYPFYENDIKNGVFTKDEIKELYKYFFGKFWSMKVPFDMPLCLGGEGENGAEITNELSYLCVEAYGSLDIYSPKIHIRVSDKTPESFIKLVLSSIRNGKSSFVFINDKVSEKALLKSGISEADAKNYVPIGCYEPCVWGKEVGCTGNGSVNLAKAFELAMFRGYDAKGKKLSQDTGDAKTFDEFKESVKKQISFACENAVDFAVKCEKAYPRVYNDAFLSSMYGECVSNGADAYTGSAKYNNSSINITGIATLVDSLCAVKRIVFDEKRVSLDGLRKILAGNWESNEKLRRFVLSLPEKYGCGNKTADCIAKEFSDHIASCVAGKKNGRGGIFKAGLFSIDRNFSYGKKTSATPDGRYAGEPLSKNLCATTSMDRNGLTALINSVCKMDLSDYANGSVLDVIMHPTAVSGDDGLSAMYSLLRTYFDIGGFAMHGNVFDAKQLKAAQKEPEKYKTLQVRVCGWNAYFVNLSTEEQNEFIKQTESAIC